MSSSCVSASIICGTNRLDHRFGDSAPYYRRRHDYLVPARRVKSDSNGAKPMAFESGDGAPVRSVADKMVDGMDFGELCDEFECISSPLVESTARQLVRDILELRQDDRTFGCFAVSVKYKDPVRSFTGRDKYKRPMWVAGALDRPVVTVQQMVMLSTSILSIKWTLTGTPKSFIGAIGGKLSISITSLFTLNQISGQVIEHEETWQLSNTSTSSQAYFWASRRLFAITESGKDFTELAKKLGTRSSSQNLNIEVYPSTDPTKFFQRDDGLQRDAYQIALLLAVIYFVVQFLKLTI